MPGLATGRDKGRGTSLNIKTLTKCRLVANLDFMQRFSFHQEILFTADIARTGSGDMRCTEQMRKPISL
jgi:hypothetical protein